MSYNMSKSVHFFADEDLIDEYKLICIDNDINVKDLSTLLVKFVIRKNSVTDNLIYYLENE